MQCDGASIWKTDDEPTDKEKSDALDQFKNQKAELYAHINETPLVEVKDEFGNINSDKARHRVLVAAHKVYELSEDLLWSDQAIEALTPYEIRNLTSQYFLMVQDFAAPRADWIAELYKEAKIELPLQDALDEVKETEADKVNIPDSHNNLVALAGSLIEDFDAHFEALGITGEEAYMELFKKASVHYSFDLTDFLYVTEMYDCLLYTSPSPRDS